MNYLTFLKPPDLTFLSRPREVNGEMYMVRCGIIFCEVCEGCMACSDSQCLAGAAHEWPPGWEELVEEIT